MLLLAAVPFCLVTQQKMLKLEKCYARIRATAPVITVLLGKRDDFEASKEQHNINASNLGKLSSCLLLAPSNTFKIEK